MKAFFALALLLSISASSAEERTLGEQLAIDNPKVVAYLEKLTDSDVGKKVKGVRLSDGSIELKGCVFLGSHVNTAKKQHIYTFRSDGHEVSYIWIDKGGSSLAVPPDPNDESGENASILSGDVFTSPRVEPGDGVIILYGGTLKWVAAQKASKR
jgi:hypothetical protein